MIYYTSDLHFGHANIIKYENRPCSNIDEMDEMLIKKWNNKVSEEDEVYILGDLTFYKNARKNIELVSRLKGKKHLIKGNHDYWVKSGYMNNLFESIHNYLKIKDNGRDVILFHYPIFNWDMQKYGSYHLYGHVHGDPEFQLKMPNTFNAGVDVNNWEPKTLDELISENQLNPKEVLREMRLTNCLGPEYPLQKDFYLWKKLREQSNYEEFLKEIITEPISYNSLDKFILYLYQDWKDVNPTEEETNVVKWVAKNYWELQTEAEDFLESVGVDDYKQNFK